MTAATGVRPARSEPSGEPIAGTPASHAVPVLGTILAVGGILGLTWSVNPRFFYLDDKQAQYMSAFADIGERLRAGEFPIIDPLLGPSGNYVIDPQYGLYNPLQWLVSVALSYTTERETAAFAHASVFLIILAVGTCLACLRLGSARWLATAAAVAVATSGYAFWWLSTSWSPGLTSLAWIPWIVYFWYAAHGRRWPLVGLAAAGFLAAAGGWPFTVAAAAVVGVCLIGEQAVLARPGTRIATVVRSKGAAILALGGGGLAGLASVVPLVAAGDSTVRSSGLGNSGFSVPNLADVLTFYVPSLDGQVSWFTAPVLTSPIFFVAGLGVVLLWLTTWRAAWRAPGVVALAASALVVGLLTQAPSDFWVLRWPFRHLAGFQLLLVMLAVVAYSAAPARPTTKRVVGIGVTALWGVALAFARRPDDLDTYVGSVLMVATGGAALWAAGRHRERTLGPVVLVSTLLLVSWNISRVEQNRDLPDWGISGSVPGSTRLAETPEPRLLLYQRSDAEQYLARYDAGASIGMTPLDADVRALPGYSSVSQSGWATRACVETHGWTCPTIGEFLWSTPVDVDRPWIDLLGLRTVAVVPATHGAAWQEGVDPSWARSFSAADADIWVRGEVDSAVGRVTWADPGIEVAARDVDRRSQTYTVEAPQGGRVVLSDVWWPGYAATLDGSPVDVAPYEGLVTEVSLPAGSSGELTITYSPPGLVASAALWGGGAALVALALVVARRLRIDADGDGHEPDTAEHL